MRMEVLSIYGKLKGPGRSTSPAAQKSLGAFTMICSEIGLGKIDLIKTQNCQEGFLSLYNFSHSNYEG